MYRFEESTSSVNDDITHRGYTKIANRISDMVNNRENNDIESIINSSASFLKTVLSKDALIELDLYGHRVYQATHPTLIVPPYLKPQFQSIHQFIHTCAVVALGDDRPVRSRDIKQSDSYKRIFEQAYMGDINSAMMDVLFSTIGFYKYPFFCDRITDKERVFINAIERGNFRDMIHADLRAFKELIVHVLDSHGTTEAAIRRYMYILGLITQFEVLVDGYIADYTGFIRTPGKTTTHFIRSLARNIRRVIYPIRPALTWVVLDLIKTSHSQYIELLNDIADATVDHQANFKERIK